MVKKGGAPEQTKPQQSKLILTQGPDGFWFLHRSALQILRRLDVNRSHMLSWSTGDTKGGSAHNSASWGSRQLPDAQRTDLMSRKRTFRYHAQLCLRATMNSHHKHRKVDPSHPSNSTRKHPKSDLYRANSDACEA